MKYSLNREGREAAYLQLYRLVREDIVKGLIPFGAKLPSKRTVADEIGVSTVTVEHAYALLSDEGYIEPRERSGYFVVFRNGEGFAATSAAKEFSNDFSEPGDAPDSDFPFSTLAKTMRAVISEYGQRILTKSPNKGTLELRGAIRDYLERSRGIFTTVDRIVLGSGSEYLYTLIVELLGRGMVFGIESPSYKKIEEVDRASEVTLEKLPLGADGIESSALSSTSAQVLHISPYRSFPSGVSASASKRHEYIRWASHSGRIIIEDDFQSEFSVSTKPEETLFSITDKDNVIYMNTFSKTISPALRVGYMVLPKELSERFSERLGFYSCTVPTFDQLVLARLIAGGDFERHINRVRRRKRRELQ